MTLLVTPITSKSIQDFTEQNSRKRISDFLSYLITLAAQRLSLIIKSYYPVSILNNTGFFPWRLFQRRSKSSSSRTGDAESVSHSILSLLWGYIGLLLPTNTANFDYTRTDTITWTSRVDNKHSHCLLASSLQHILHHIQFILEP